MERARPRKLVIGAALCALLCALGLAGVLVQRALSPRVTLTPTGLRAGGDEAPATETEEPDDAPRALLGEVVSDADGRAIAGAEVRAELEGGGAAHAVTADDGTFALEGLRARIVRVRFKASGYRTHELEADALPALREAFITEKLTPAPGAGPSSDEVQTGVQLTVVDERGAPVPRYVATVSRRARERPEARTPPSTVDVDDTRGAVRIAFAPGPVAITVVAEGFRPSERTDAEVQEGAPTVVEVRLERSSEVRGVVRDAETRAPIAGAEVTVAAVRGALPAFTDDEGRFVLRSVVAEDMSLTVRAAGYLDLDMGGVRGARSRAEVVELWLTPKKEGVGAEVVGIGVQVAPHKEGVLIRGVLDGSPATDQLGPGDLILEVDREPLGPLKMRERIARIRGEAGTEVELAVRKHNGDIRRIRVERARVGVPDG